MISMDLPPSVNIRRFVIKAVVVVLVAVIFAISGIVVAVVVRGVDKGVVFLLSSCDIIACHLLQNKQQFFESSFITSRRWLMPRMSFFVCVFFFCARLINSGGGLPVWQVIYLASLESLQTVKKCSWTYMHFTQRRKSMIQLRPFLLVADCICDVFQGVFLLLLLVGGEGRVGAVFSFR